ncbi:hypothetical protein [Parvibaculum sp.]|uniref:hypothetical protein n=1 Tax=Parvibaculum sp. TaxID=2024848 RepID=UPI001B129FD3|nr:hypothetical protein [Parvibaculum sp.]MBO6633153.1 hypothetical protein [Parvibaculum sp.]MBO6679610.1 hypothetical protein [Parvibaculum sp.]MBO6684881.1 hypothetical protein [Parvibaculum sp.]MBO6905511.1 hypothetical protein [Parvibaculum sp.]
MSHRAAHRDPDPAPLPDAPRASALAAGIGARLAVALGGAAVLWLAVFWALAR